MTFKNDAQCQICGNNNNTIIGKPQISQKASSLIKEDYRIVKCNDCGFYFVTPPIKFSDAEWRILYDDEYFQEETKWGIERRRKDRAIRLNRLEKAIPAKIENFLDVGCGQGNVLIDASRKGWKVYGMDISDNRIDLARTKEITFVKGDIFQAKFPGNYFDCVYMDSVLEHVMDPLAYLKEINRIMKTGGVFYIGIPNENRLINDVKKYLYMVTGNGAISTRINPFVSPYHVVGFTKKALIVAAAKTNFEIARFRNFAGQYEFLKFKMFSRPFLIHLLLLPVDILAIFLRKQYYFEVILRKKT